MYRVVNSNAALPTAYLDNPISVFIARSGKELDRANWREVEDFIKSN